MPTIKPICLYCHLARGDRASLLAVFFGICYSEYKTLVCFKFHTPFLFPATKSVKNVIVSKKTHGGGDLVGKVN